MTTPEPHPQTEPLPTVDKALANTARLLYAAELDTDLKRMERYEKLADSWLAYANVLLRREEES